MRGTTILVLIFVLTLLVAMPAWAGDLFSYDGWLRWGYTFDADWGATEVPSHDFFWARFNIHGDFSDNVSYFVRYQGAKYENPLGGPFQLDLMWYYLSFKTPIGQFNLGRQAIMPSLNEEMVFELNGMYGNTVAFYPSLPKGFTGCLAAAYNPKVYPMDSNKAFLALLDYNSEKWSAGLNYFDHTRTGLSDDPMISMEFSYRIQPFLSLNLELGRNVVYLPESPLSEPPFADNVALIGLRYMNPHWMVFAGYNLPVEEYALDVFYLFNPNWALRTEYNNSFANYSPLFQVSLYYMFTSPRPKGEGN